MDPRSQVLLRHPSLCHERLLLVGLPDDALLGHCPHATGWSWHAGTHSRLNQRFEARSHFGTQPPTQAQWEHAVVFLPKSRELTDYVLQTLIQKRPHGMLYLVGEKRAGIERAAKQLSALGTARKLDSARHCQLWQAAVTAPIPDQRPDPHTFEVALPLIPHPPLKVLSLAGVFSHGRLDQGTALLLKHLERLPEGPLLDFGCGAGILGAALKIHYPTAEVSLLDVDAFALESTRQTLAANQLTAQIIAGDGIEAAPHQLAAIVSNPPFHQGVHTDYQISEHLIRQAKVHLKPGGVLRIVANSFLRYPELIEQHLGPCQTLAEERGFRVYQAQKA